MKTLFITNSSCYNEISVITIFPSKYTCLYCTSYELPPRIANIYFQRHLHGVRFDWDLLFNRLTQKYFEFSLLILGYKLLQLKCRGDAMINGKYMKHVGHSLHREETITVNGLYPRIRQGKPTFDEFRMTINGQFQYE